MKSAFYNILTRELGHTFLYAIAAALLAFAVYIAFFVVFLYQRSFGTARHIAGSSGQPTTPESLSIYRMLPVNNLVHFAKRSSGKENRPELPLQLHVAFQ